MHQQTRQHTKRNVWRRLLLLLAVVGLTPCISSISSYATVPQTIPYQGYLKDAAGTPVNGVVNITLNLYTVANGGTAIWTGTRTGMNVSKGLFKVDLGSVTPFPVGVFATPVYLGVRVGTDAEMTPRTVLNSAPFALHADDADNVGGIPATSVLCHQGDFLNCYTGPAGTAGVGQCAPGTRSCGATGWDAVCTGETIPTPEVCNGLDDNCNGQVDEGLTTGGGPWFLDADSDGFGDPFSTPSTACLQPVGFVADNTDCDDVNAATHPGAVEICDGKDNNCNGVIDEGGVCGLPSGSACASGATCASGICIPFAPGSPNGTCQ